MKTESKPTTALIKEIAALKQKKFRDETGHILVEGRHPIEEAFRAGLKLHHLLIQVDAPVDSYPNIEFSLEPLSVDGTIMARIATTNSPPPCLAVFDCPKPVTQVQGNLVLVLDAIQDPGNLGTLIRSAVAFGFETVILAGDTVEAYNPKVIRASAGLVFAVPMMQVSTAELKQALEPSAWTVWTTTGQPNATPYKEADFSGQCAIVLGNEGRGVSPSLLADTTVRSLTIPMTERVESLNVAVSGSIIMAEAAASRRPGRAGQTEAVGELASLTDTVPLEGETGPA